MKSPKRITVPVIRGYKQSQQKIVMCTAYDFTMGALVDQAGVEIVLIGDSLGMVIQGEDTTLPVTMDQMIYHCRCVSNGVAHALLVGDMPFMSYQSSISSAIEAAGRFLKEGRVSAVKLEGGVAVAETIRHICALDIPVMGHIGLTPQSYHRMGGHLIQGKKSGSESEAGTRERIITDAKAVAEAGAFAVVLEGIPFDLAAEITNLLAIPTIGIGAGRECDGQVLVINDLLGLTVGPVPPFAKQFSNLGVQAVKAIEQFGLAVRQKQFPSASIQSTTVAYGQGIVS